MRRLGVILTALALSLPLTPASARRPADDCAWPMYGHDPGRSFSQRCSKIGRGNVSSLKLKWVVPTDANVSASTSVAGGIAYVGDWNGTFRALNAETGWEIWSFQVDDTHNVPFGRIVSTAAIDRIHAASGETVPAVVFAGGATLYALDPKTGALLAKQDVDPRDAATKTATPDAEVEIESSPVIGRFSDGDRVFIGMDVHNGKDIGRTGMLAFRLVATPAGPEPYAFDLVWKFDPETGAVRHSLTEGSGTGFGCGGVWSSPSLDREALSGHGLIAFGTSNCEFPDESAAAGEVAREGIFAINATTGELVWEYHPRGPNVVDDDFGATPNMLPVRLDGDLLIGEGGKDGFYYALSREGNAGQPDLKWTSHAGQSGHATVQFAFGGIIGTPAVGRVAPRFGRPTTAVFAATALSTPVAGPLDGDDPGPDLTLLDDPGRMFSLHAIDALTGTVLWRTPLVRQAYGAPTYSNGVLFVPSTFGLSVQAFDANTGVMLWAHPLNGPPSSSPTVAGDSIYVNVGTSQGGIPPAEVSSGIWAFELASSSFAPSKGVLLSPQANQLDVYDLSAPLPGLTRSTPIHSHQHDPSKAPGEDRFDGNGNDVNGQQCRVRQADGKHYYVMGEDSDQSGLPNGVAQGWGIFRPDNGHVGPWALVDKLVPTYNFTDPPNDHLPDNTGCAVSTDGNILFTIDLGEGALPAGAFGSVFAFYRDGNGNFSGDSKYCVLDNHITTGGYVAIDPADGSLLVPQSGRQDGGFVTRFSPPFPPDGDNCAAVAKSDFIKGIESFVPISIAYRKGKWLVGNTVPGMVHEYNADGTFSRPIAVLQGPGVAGIAVDEAGNVYIANLGLVPCETILCPFDGAGAVWKVSFDPVGDVPLPPVLVQPLLTYPDGLGIVPSLE